MLDLTCGTGSQVYWLHRRGFDVAGSDINTEMLAIAKSKAKKDRVPIKFVKADMRTASIGTFDAVITIFNAIGHLTKADFEKTIKNIRRNLNDGGLYIFDIFNLDFLLEKDNITTFTIDWFKRGDENTARVIQYSTIDKNGVMASFTTSYEQNAGGRVKKTQGEQTLQVYSGKQLRDLLQRNGFAVIKQCAIDGSKFKKTKTDRILTVAKKL